MAFDRTTIVRGPCKITYDGATFYSKGGVTMTLTNSTFDKETDAYGVAGRGKTDMTITVEFEPVGEIEALTVLFPYASTVIGASIFTGTDKPLVITSVAATYTIKCAAVTQMPSLRLTANNTAFGSVQFTGILDRTTGDPADIASYYTTGAGGSIDGSAFNPALITAGPYSAQINSDPIFFSETGFEIAFDQSNTPIVVDGYGTVDMALANLGATITSTPVGVAGSVFEAYFDELSAGKELTQFDLAVTIDDTIGALLFQSKAQVIDFAQRFSPSENRIGQVTMQAVRTFTSSGPNPLFSITLSE